MEEGVLHVIGDLVELAWFADNVLPPLKNTEVYFLSLSARNKYLTTEERELYSLGRTEMFAKSIVHSSGKEHLIRAVRRFEVNDGGYTTKTFMPVPQKALVCYFNINPSDTIKAVNAFQTTINEYNIEMASFAYGREGIENFTKRYKKLDIKLLNCYQQAHGTRHYIDIDFDVAKNINIGPAFDWLEEHGIRTYYCIDTKSGYHILIKKDELKFNPQNFIDFCKDNIFNMSADANKEIEVNKNQMIPLPGTIQAGHVVTIINKYKYYRNSYK